MSAPPSGAHTLSLGAILRASGVKGGEQPLIAAGTMVPVMVMADFSSSFSGEPLEARLVVGDADTVTDATDHGWFRIDSRGPGGIIVEAVTIASTVGGAFVDRVPTDQIPAPSFERVAAQVQTGGLTGLSQSFIGRTTAPPQGAGPLDLSTFFGFAAVYQALHRVWVPSGSSLIFISQGVGNGIPQQWNPVAVYREIPAAIGLP